jgi:hypothetical protein
MTDSATWNRRQGTSGPKCTHDLRENLRFPQILADKGLVTKTPELQNQMENRHSPCHVSLSKKRCLRRSQVWLQIQVQSRCETCSTLQASTISANILFLKRRSQESEAAHLISEKQKVLMNMASLIFKMRTHCQSSYQSEVLQKLERHLPGFQLNMGVGL